MRFFDYITLAYKNLTRQKSRTILTIIAITVGSLSLILMVSIIVSIHQSLVDQFQDLGAFNLVTVIKDPNSTDTNNLIGSNGNTENGKKIDDTTLATMRALPHVVAATPTATASFSTMRLSDGEKKTWASIIALDPANDVFNASVAYGRKLESGDMDKIVVGSRFISETGYSGDPQQLIGKQVILNYKMGGNSAPDWGPLPEQPPMNADKSWYESQGKSGLEIQAEIVGITDTSGVDDGSSYISMAWARRLMTNVSWQWDSQKSIQEVEKDGKKYNQENFTQTLKLVKEDNLTSQGYVSIVLKIDDPANLTAVANEVKGTGYGASTAQAMLDQINQILTLIGLVLSIIGGISLFVAAIGIINTMIMATFERTREIGVMRACGATKATIRRLFTFEAAMLGFAGGTFGIVISLVLGFVARLVVEKNAVSLGSLPVDQIGAFPWWLIISVVIFTTILGMLSGLYPAIRASKMKPVDALRYE